MPTPHKIATCCYCGTRAALVLKGRQRHELSCSSCGAPLHDLKMLPRKKFSDPQPRKPVQSRAPQKKPRRKKKGLFTRVLDEAWDVIEDVFD
ncbi:MAG: hypothetical protein ACWA49_13575 [Ruegeria sp.]